MSKQTVLASLAAVALAIFPGFFVGELVAGIYSYLMGHFAAAAPYMVRAILILWLAGLIAGLIIGHLAIAPARYLFKSANIMVAAHCVAVLAVAVGAVWIYLVVTADNPYIDPAPLAARSLGVILAAYQAARAPKGEGSTSRGASS